MITVVLPDLEHDFATRYHAAAWLASELSHDDLKRLLIQVQWRIAANLDRMRQSQEPTNPSS